MALVPYLYDDITDIALHQSALANLSRRTCSPLHGSVHAVELGPLFIAQDPRPVMDVEIVPGHGNFLSEVISPLRNNAPR